MTTLPSFKRRKARLLLSISGPIRAPFPHSILESRRLTTAHQAYPVLGCSEAFADVPRLVHAARLRPQIWGNHVGGKIRALRRGLFRDARLSRDGCLGAEGHVFCHFGALGVLDR
jgi:hypothetical protein